MAGWWSRLRSRSKNAAAAVIGFVIAVCMTIGGMFR